MHEGVEGVVAEPEPRSRSFPRAPAAGGSLGRVLAWVLVVGWLASTVGIALSADRASDLSDLRAALADGSVSRVGVAGGLSEGATGSARVELYWSERGLRQVAVARQVRGDLAAGAGSNDGRPEIRGDVTEFLAQVDADVEVVRVESTLLRSGVRYSAFGWEVVGALAWALVGLSIATVFVLVTAREHWRATPWAWFWLILLVPPLGALGYLVGGGPTGVRRPGPASGRLTGGWAFLLAVVASSLW